MENYIVLESSKKIREIARNALAGYWKPVLLAMLIYYLLSTGISSVLGYFFATTTGPIDVYGQTVNYSISYGSGIYDFLVQGPLSYGLCMFMLAFFRSKKTDNGLIFEGFGHFGKAFLLFLLMSVKIFLWTLLFIVPGFIAGFRYSQSFFILADHPEYTVSQCIEESKRLMNGNKAHLFGLQFSFIGWYLLASLPSSIATTSMNSGIGALIVGIILEGFMIFVYAYMNVANTAFYELATRNLVVVEGVEPDKVVSGVNYQVHEDMAEDEKNAQPGSTSASSDDKKNDDI